MSGDVTDITAVWLEFHDLDVSGVRWEEDTLIVSFSFGTVYDEAYTYNSYRTGEIRFEKATFTGDFPEDWDEDTYVSTGDIYVGLDKLSNFPIPGVTSTTASIHTRFHFVEWQEPRVTSASVVVSIYGLYDAEKPEWHPAPS